MFPDVSIIIVSFFVAAVTFLIYGKWNGKDNSRCRYPPSLPSLPLVGSLPFLRNFGNISEFFMEKSKHLGPVFTFRVGKRAVLALNSKEVIEEALVKNSRSFSFRPKMYIERIGNPNNKGIVMKDTTPEWKRSHQTALSILKEFGFGVKNLMEERILTEVEAMTDYVRKKKSQSFDPKELTILVTSNVMMSILFGYRRDYDLGLSQMIHEADKFVLLLDMVYDIAPFLKYIPPYRQKLSEMDVCARKIRQDIEIEIEKCLQDPENNCFVRRYIETEGSDYDQEQLNYVIRDMIAAGTDTTANTFRWLLVALANHSDIQKKLLEDVDSVIPRGRLPSLPDQAKLPYVEATILELYRWRTLTPLSAPRYTSSDAVLYGHFIPSGTLVLPNLYCAHNNPTVWGDPDVFRPERFLDADSNPIKRDLVIPFGLGRRSCLGETLARAEIFLILACLVQRFIVLPPESQERVFDKAELPIKAVTVPEPFAIRLIERQ